jgi:hypothetical protein
MPLEMSPLTDVTAGNKVSRANDVYHEVSETFIWPRDPTGWVFLGRAVHAVGSAMFPAWKRYTPYCLLPDICVGAAIGGEIIAEEDQERYAYWLINVRGDDPDYIFRTNRPFDYLNEEVGYGSVTAQEWEFACDLSQEEWAIGFGNERMFNEVQLRFVQEAEAGKLNFGGRPFEGGEPKQMPRDWWFTDRYAARFRSLTINPEEPFAQTTPPADVANHIFVRADDLAALLSSIPAAERLVPMTVPTSTLSPYVRLMLEVHDHLGIDPNLPPKKVNVLHEIESRWSLYNLPPSGNLMNVMATLLRNPESQAGRGRKDALPRTSKG